MPVFALEVGEPHVVSIGRGGGEGGRACCSCCSFSCFVLLRAATTASGVAAAAGGKSKKQGMRKAREFSLEADEERSVELSMLGFVHCLDFGGCLNVYLCGSCCCCCCFCFEDMVGEEEEGGGAEGLRDG